MLQENIIHPPHAPRLRAHIGLIRWERTRDGDWVPRIVRGQFMGGDTAVWRIRLYSGIELEYDLDVWSPFE